MWHAVSAVERSYAGMKRGATPNVGVSQGGVVTKVSKNRAEPSEKSALKTSSKEKGAVSPKQPARK